METIPQTELERLELLDKKMDIRKKRMDIRKEKLNIEEQQDRQIIALNNQHLLVEQIEELRKLLAEYTIDSKRNLVGGDPFFVPVLQGKERGIVLGKLVDLIRRL